MATVIGTLRADLEANTGKFRAGLGRAGKQLDAFRKRVDGIGKGMQRMGAKMSIGITAPVIAGFAGIVRAAGDFEASMNRVGAATDASASQFDNMRKLAMELGRTTSFSASQAADAMEILAKNGLSVEQILGGAADASLKLAAASGTSLANAGDIATDVMAAFGKEASELGPVVDGITGVMLSSKFGIDDYRLALAQAGGAVGKLGVDLEEFNTLLAMTASSFASGSDAGTSLRNFIVRLTPVSTAAANAMKDYNLQFFNANGSMKDMTQIVDELNQKLGGLSDQEKTDVVSTIFGQDAMRTALSLMERTGAEFEELMANVAGASATDQAAARMKGFNGEMKKLASAFEALQLAIADSGLIAFVTEIVQWLAQLVSHLSQTNPQLLKWGTVIAGVAAAMGPFVGVLGSLLRILPLLLGPIGLLTAALTALGLYIMENWEQITAILQAGWDKFKEIFPGMGAIVEEWVPIIIETLASMVQQIKTWVVDKLGAIWDSVGNKLQQVGDWFRQLQHDVVGGSYVPDMVDGISKEMDRLDSEFVGKAQQATSQVGSLFQSLGGEVKGLITNMIKGGEVDIEGFIQSISSKLIDFGMNALFGGMGGGGMGGGGGGGIGGMLGGLFGGGGGGGGLGGIFGSLFGGFFAQGGRPPIGRMSIVGEDGPELFVPRTSGEVVPGGDVGGINSTVNIFATDVNSFMSRATQTQMQRQQSRQMERATRGY